MRIAIGRESFKGWGSRWRISRSGIFWGSGAISDFASLSVILNEKSASATLGTAKSSIINTTSRKPSLEEEPSRLYPVSLKGLQKI